jgi:hypothetical protein
MLLTAANAADSAKPSGTQAASTHTRLMKYGNLPLAFEQNRGQAAGEIEFITRGENYTAFIGESAMTLALMKPGTSQANSKLSRASKIQPAEVAALRVNFGGAVGSRLQGTQTLPGKMNYFIGSDPGTWHSNVATFARVRSAELYPGIGVEYHGVRGKFEYDFVVKPGADPRRIKLQFEGTESLRVSQEGDLIIQSGGAEFRFKKPDSYQQRDADREPVESHYIVASKQEAAFELAPYDRGRTVVIDPVLDYSTFLGGNSDDGANDIALDREGNAYVTGFTVSSNFPATTGAPPPPLALQAVAFVTKFNASGTALLYSTLLGGGGTEANGIAVDADGNAYVSGTNVLGDFPVTASAFQSANAGKFDAFLSKLDPSGSTLLYSSYLGGNADDIGLAVAVDSRGNAYVAGTVGCAGCTMSSFPTTAGAFQRSFGSGQVHGWIARFDTTKSGAASVVYSTLLGGNGNEDLPADIAVRDGRAYVTGEADSADFPVTPGAYQTTCAIASQPCSDAFVTELNHDGSGLVFSTYLGGTGTDVGHSIAVDSRGNVYVTGETRSTDFPLRNPFQAMNRGGINSQDAFMTKLNANGSGLIYSTYLGGSGDDIGFGIAVDAFGNAHVTGWTYSTNFPLRDAIQTSNVGTIDVFVSKFNEAGNHLSFSTYLGGANNDLSLRIRVDARRAIYVTGLTASNDFPVTPGVFQETYGGGALNFDAFVFKICVVGCPNPKK